MRAHPSVDTIPPQSEKRTRGDSDPRTPSHALRKHHNPVNRLTRDRAHLAAGADDAAGAEEDDPSRSETPTLVDEVELEAARLASMRKSVPPPADEEIDIV